jgi:hypothetical protein
MPDDKNDKNGTLNLYGDALVDRAKGRGSDISSQRADDLDLAAVAWVGKLIEKGIRPACADEACGAAGQTLRLLEAGADVRCFDIEDFSEDVARAMSRAEELRGPGASTVGATFTRRGLTDEREPGELDLYDVVCCQRAIHYLPRDKAALALERIVSTMARGGKLFISASGMASELSEGYEHAGVSVHRRFAPLAPAMAEKHGIRSSVCLYSEGEVVDPLLRAGLVVERTWLSPFGNVKAVGRKGERIGRLS